MENKTQWWYSLITVIRKSRFISGIKSGKSWELNYSSEVYSTYIVRNTCSNHTEIPAIGPVHVADKTVERMTWQCLMRPKFSYIYDRVKYRLNLGLGGVIFNTGYEPTKDFSSKLALFLAIFPSLLCLRFIYFPSVALSTLELLRTIMVLSGSSITSVATWPPAGLKVFLFETSIMCDSAVSCFLMQIGINQKTRKSLSSLLLDRRPRDHSQSSLVDHGLVTFGIC